MNIVRPDPRHHNRTPIVKRSMPLTPIYDHIDIKAAQLSQQKIVLNPRAPAEKAINKSTTEDHNFSRLSTGTQEDDIEKQKLKAKIEMLSGCMKAYEDLTYTLRSSQKHHMEKTEEVVKAMGNLKEERDLSKKRRAADEERNKENITKELLNVKKDLSLMRKKVHQAHSTAAEAQTAAKSATTELKKVGQPAVVVPFKESVNGSTASAFSTKPEEKS